jgi:hypothetical protein
VVADRSRFLACHAQSRARFMNGRCFTTRDLLLARSQPFVVHNRFEEQPKRLLGSISITYSDLKSGWIWCFIIYKALYLYWSDSAAILSSRGSSASYIPQSAKAILTSIGHVGILPNKG